MTTPHAKVQAIVSQEVDKLKTWSDAEPMLEKDHLERLELLAKVLKHIGEVDEPEAPPPAEKPMTQAEALVALEGI